MKFLLYWLKIDLIQLFSQVLDFDFEPEKDFLLIRDGTSPSDPLLAKLTGNAENNPKFILSTRNKIYIYMQTSYGDSRKGFSIRFRAGNKFKYIMLCKDIYVY